MRFARQVSKLRLLDQTESALEPRRVVLDDEICPHDTGDGKSYLAGYARTRTAPEVWPDWVVLVRHERGQALAAVEELDQRTRSFRLLTYGLTVAGVASRPIFPVCVVATAWKA